MYPLILEPRGRSVLDKGKITVFGILLLSGFFSLSCIQGFTSAKFLSVQVQTKEDRDQEINYHIKQIKKYKAEVEREEQNERRSLSNRSFSDARTAQERKARAMQKIYQHRDAIKKLQSGEQE